LRRAVTALVVAALVAGCGSSKADEVNAHVDEAMAEVRASASDGKLRATMAKLRGDRPSTETGQRARRLALAGLAAALHARASRRAFTENDSGNVEAATRDAENAYRYSRRAAWLVRAAERLTD
jgi:hypothetical protein